MLERTIRIIFEGDDRSQAAFRGVSRGLDDVETAVRSVTGPLAGLADDILRTEAVFAGLAVGGLLLATQRASEFSYATSEISTLVTDVSFNIGAFRDAILNYALTSTQSIENINSAIYQAISRGTEWQDSIERMSAAERLAVAGKADLTGSLVLLNNTMNAYGAANEEAERYANLLFQTVRMGGTTIPELAQSLSSVTTVAAAAQVPFETVAAAIAALTVAGAPTSEAMTYLRAVISSIVSPSTEAAAAAERLGIEFNAGALASRGLEVVMQDVYRATGGNIEVISELFGNVRGLTGQVALFGPTAGEPFLRTLAEMNSGADVLSRAYGIMVQELSLRNQQLVNSMDVTFIRIGLLIQEEAIDMVGALTRIFQGLAVSLDDGAFDGVIRQIQSFSQQMADYLSGVGDALPDALAGVDWSGFTESLRRVADQVIDLLQAMFPQDMTTVDGLTDAIQRVVNAFTTLNNITAGIIESWQPVFRVLGLLVQELGDSESAVSSWAREIGNMLGGAQVIDQLIERFGLLGAAAVSAAIHGLDPAANSATDVIGQMHDLTTHTNEAAGSLGEQLVSALSRFTGGARDASTEANALGEGVDSIPDEKQIDIRAQGAGEVFNEITGIGQSLGEIPPETTFQLNIGGVDGVLEMIRQAGWELDQIPPETITRLAASPDAASFYATWQELEMAFEDVTDVSVVASADTPSVAATTDYLDSWLARDRETRASATPDGASVAGTTQALDTMAADRTVAVDVESGDVELQLERLRGQFDLMQSSVEWSARLDIAHVEANAQIVAALAGTLASAFESSGQIISSALDAWSEMDDSFWNPQRRWLERIVEDELRLRERAMDLTAALVNTQIEYMNAKMRQMARGDALVQIDGAGLQPHLEAFMWEILSAIQTRVNEEGHAMLFGI